MASSAKDATNQRELIIALRDALGDAGLREDPVDLTIFASDIYRTGGTPLAAVRPADPAQLQMAVRLCAQAGVAMVPRGGGASYNDGTLVPAGGHVVFDTRALDMIAIDAANALVTVGAGVTWAKLKEALDPLGLRTPFWGPFSGITSTVGGSVSSHAISHGTAAHGISAQSVLSMDVVTASGEVFCTSPARAMRHYGPDLTGLFTGDCGTLGIKAAIRLPLIRAARDFATLSFAFDNFAAYHAAARTAQRERLDDSHFGVDLVLSQGQIVRQTGFAARLKIARDVMRKAPRKRIAVRQLLRMALAGEDPMRAGAYMCHFIVDGCDAADAAGKARRLRQVLGKYGREIAGSVPSFVKSVPFAPLYSMLGPGGERWVALHGVLEHEQAVPFDAALQSFLAERRSEMQRLGVWLGTMFSPTGPAGFLYEIALYWPDNRLASHHDLLDPQWLAGLPAFPENPAARAFADQLKTEIIALFQQFGAGHLQLGRSYPYQSRLSKPAAALLRAIKQELDPDGLMNPGALGL